MAAEAGDQFNPLPKPQDFRKRRKPKDVRERLAHDPIERHDPDCCCERCRIGDLEYIRQHYPSEY